jgi:hypothetical protein
MSWWDIAGNEGHEKSGQICSENEWAAGKEIISDGKHGQ